MEGNQQINESCRDVAFEINQAKLLAMQLLIAGSVWKYKEEVTNLIEEHFNELPKKSSEILSHECSLWKDIEKSHIAEFGRKPFAVRGVNLLFQTQSLIQEEFHVRQQLKNAVAAALNEDSIWCLPGERHPEVIHVDEDIWLNETIAGPFLLSVADFFNEIVDSLMVIRDFFFTDYEEFLLLPTVHDSAIAVLMPPKWETIRSLTVANIERSYEAFIHEYELATVNSRD